MAPPPENDTSCFFVFLQLNWKDKIKQTTSRESARWLQSCCESSTETSRVRSLYRAPSTHIHTHPPKLPERCVHHISLYTFSI